MCAALTGKAPSASHSRLSGGDHAEQDRDSDERYRGPGYPLAEILQRQQREDDRRQAAGAEPADERGGPAAEPGAGQREATGAILITVTLSTAYTTSCQVRASSAGAMATAPNASQTSSDTSAPVSSTNGTSGSPRRAAERQPAHERGDKAVAVQCHRRGVRAHRQAQHGGPGEPFGGPAAAAGQPEQPAPAPPTTAPTARPTVSSAAAAPGPIPGSCAAVPAPASATSTNGVAIPSLSPLSTLISRRILAGIAD
jgi:hypothetical protein